MTDFITQSKLTQAQERQARLTNWLTTVLEQYDYETRAEEKLRMEQQITAKTNDLKQVEAEITELTQKLNDA